MQLVFRLLSRYDELNVCYATVSICSTRHSASRKHGHIAMAQLELKPSITGYIAQIQRS